MSAGNGALRARGHDVGDMMAEESLVPTNTPFDYDVGIDYDASPVGRSGYSITADLAQITQYFRLIHTYQDTQNPGSTTPSINQNEQAVISFVTGNNSVVGNAPLELTMGTWDSAVVQGTTGNFSAGLMDSSSYTDAWVQMLIAAFGGTAAVQEGLKAITLGNELDNPGQFVPGSGDPSYATYLSTWLPQAMQNLKTSLSNAGLGGISVTTSIAAYGNAAALAISNTIAQNWSANWNGNVPWALYNIYPQPFPPADPNPPYNTAVNPDVNQAVVPYLQSVANARSGSPAVFVGETGYSSAFTDGTHTGLQSEALYYQSLFSYLSGQQASGPTTPVFLFQAFDDPGRAPPFEQQFGVFADDPGNNFQPTGLKAGIAIPSWVGQVLCFAEGTRIQTERGDVAVEALREGDAVSVLIAGGTANVVWIGRRHIDCLRHRRPEQVWPIRIAAGAFGDGVPRCDLLLSPDHAIFVHDVLIPVRYLVNHTSVAPVRCATVTYYHVELARHDVLLAEGLAVESLLGTVDRANFANGGGHIALHPDFHSRLWEAKGCAPLVVAGAKLAAVRAKLEARANRASDESVAASG